MTVAVLVCAGKAQTSKNLFVKPTLQSLDVNTDVITDGFEMDGGFSVITRKENCSEQVDDFFKDDARWKRVSVTMLVEESSKRVFLA